VEPPQNLLVLFPNQNLRKKESHDPFQASAVGSILLFNKLKSSTSKKDHHHFPVETHLRTTPPQVEDGRTIIGRDDTNEKVIDTPLFPLNSATKTTKEQKEGGKIFYLFPREKKINEANELVSAGAPSGTLPAPLRRVESFLAGVSIIERQGMCLVFYIIITFV
jgi:hypothetical protein